VSETSGMVGVKGGGDSLLVLNHLWRRVMWVAAGPCSDRLPGVMRIPNCDCFLCSDLCDLSGHLRQM